MNKYLDYNNAAVYGGIASIVLLAGIAILLKWVSSQVSTRRHADSLTPEDLRVLETSANRLVEEIKETAAVACRDLDDRCEDLRKLILHADQKISLWAQLTSDTEPAKPSEHPEGVQHFGRPTDHHPERSTEQHPELVEGRVQPGPQSRIFELAEAGMSPADIARETEMPVGEVTLILSLRSTVRV